MTYDAWGRPTLALLADPDPQPPSDAAQIRCSPVAEPPGAGCELHRHPHEETLVIQAGRARVTIDEDRFEADPGELVIIPPMSWHRLESVGAEPLRRIEVQPVDEPRTEWLRAA